MPTAPTRLHILDALRGFAAVAVALFHFTNALAPTVFQQICNQGRLGVDCFFVISGFVIPYSLCRLDYRIREHGLRFLQKRLIRLHIPFLASIIVVVALGKLSTLAASFQGQPPDYSVVQFLLHPLLLVSICGSEWLQPVYWTLAIELQFYLLIALLMGGLNGARARFLCLLGALLALACLPVPTVWIIRYLPLFVQGLLMLLYHQSKINCGQFALALAVAAVIGVRSLGCPEMLMGTLTAVAISCVRCGLPGWLTWPGTISYSLYLLHVPIGGRVINLAKRYPLETIGAQMLVTGLALIVSLLAAWAFYRWVEMPAQRWSSRLRYRTDF